MGKQKRKKKKGTWLITIGFLFIIAAMALGGYNLWDAARAERESKDVADVLIEEIPGYEPAKVGDLGNVAELTDPTYVVPTESAGQTEASGGDGTTEGGESAQGSGSGNALADAEVLARRKRFYFQFPDREMPTTLINGYRYIGVLEVPTLGLRLPVMSELDMTRLRTAPCRYSGSLYKSNLVIAGHNYSQHFSHLKWVDLGTDIYFTDMENNRYHFQIAWVDTLSPSQVEEMITKNGNNDWDMTLFTCTTSGQTRYTIRCVFVE